MRVSIRIAVIMGILKRMTKRAKFSIINLEILWFHKIYMEYMALSIYFMKNGMVEKLDDMILFLYLEWEN